MPRETVEIDGVELVKDHLESAVERFKEEVEQGSSQGVREGGITIVDDGDEDDWVAIITYDYGLVSDRPISEIVTSEKGEIAEHYTGTTDTVRVEEASSSYEGDYFVFITTSGVRETIPVKFFDTLTPDGYTLNHLGRVESGGTKDGREFEDLTYFLLIEEE